MPLIAPATIESDRLPEIIAPPPLLYLGAFALGVLADLVAPLSITGAAAAPRVFGLLLLTASGAFARWAFATMRQRGTSASPRQQSAALTTGGPFALSRNPIYLAMTGLYGGAALLLNSAWPLLLLPFLLVLMQWGVIRREERYLAALFGDAYADYTAKVRRWF